jgi:hypothetical protein
MVVSTTKLYRKIIFFFIIHLKFNGFSMIKINIQRFNSKIFSFKINNMRICT